MSLFLEPAVYMSNGRMNGKLLIFENEISNVIIGKFFINLISHYIKILHRPCEKSTPKYIFHLDYKKSIY